MFGAEGRVGTIVASACFDHDDWRMRRSVYRLGALRDDSGFGGGGKVRVCGDSFRRLRREKGYALATRLERVARF